jgi:hypothetical protein
LGAQGPRADHASLQAVEIIEELIAHPNFDIFEDAMALRELLKDACNDGNVRTAEWLVDVLGEHSKKEVGRWGVLSSS